MVETRFLLENLWISKPPLSILEKFQCSSALPGMKYDCAILFLCELRGSFVCALKYIFHRPPLKNTPNLLKLTHGVGGEPICCLTSMLFCHLIFSCYNFRTTSEPKTISFLLIQLNPIPIRNLNKIDQKTKTGKFCFSRYIVKG